jgi:hypothetical protein
LAKLFFKKNTKKKATFSLALAIPLVLLSRQQFPSPHSPVAIGQSV